MGVDGGLEFQQSANNQTEGDLPMMECRQSREEATRRNTARLLTPKYCVNIGTWNAQTLWETAKGLKLAREIDRYGLEVLGVIECTYTGSTRMQIADKTVIYSGRNDGLHRGGVALFCLKNSASALTEWAPFFEMLLVARFDATGAKMTSIMCCAPTKVSGEEEKDAFYNKLMYV